MPNYCSYCLRNRATGGPCEHCGAIQLGTPAIPLTPRDIARMLRRRAEVHTVAADTIERLCDRVEALEGMVNIDEDEARRWKL